MYISQGFSAIFGKNPAKIRQKASGSLPKIPCRILDGIFAQIVIQKFSRLRRAGGEQCRQRKSLRSRKRSGRDRRFKPCFWGAGYISSPLGRHRQNGKGHPSGSGAQSVGKIRQDKKAGGHQKNPRENASRSRTIKNHSF